LEQVQGQSEEHPHPPIHHEEWMEYLEGFWFLLEDFLKIMFLHDEIFEFP
jgi:hypothetical protein